MPFTVRPTVEDDWREVRALRLEMLADTPIAFGETLAEARLVREPEWRRRAARGSGSGRTSLAAIDASGRWLGTMGGYLELGRPTLVTVYVTPDARGAASGVADALLAGVAEWAAEHGDVLGLLVHEDNPRAIAFYERAGFARTGRRVPYPLDPTREELELERSVR